MRSLVLGFSINATKSQSFHSIHEKSESNDPRMKSIWMLKPNLHLKLRTARISCSWLKKNRKPQSLKNSAIKESNKASIFTSRIEMDAKETQTWITWTEEKKKYLDVSYG